MCLARPGGPDQSCPGFDANRLQLRADLGERAELPHPPRSMNFQLGSLPGQLTANVAQSTVDPASRSICPCCRADSSNASSPSAACSTVQPGALAHQRSRLRRGRRDEYCGWAARRCVTVSGRGGAAGPAARLPSSALQYFHEGQTSAMRTSFICTAEPCARCGISRRHRARASLPGALPRRRSRAGPRRREGIATCRER